MDKMLGSAKRKKKGEVESCEIGVDLSTSGVQESAKALVLEGIKPVSEVCSYRRVTIHDDQELNESWSKNVSLFERISKEDGSIAENMYFKRARLMESLVSYCKSSHNVTSIHQEYLDIIYDELSKQKFKLKCLKEKHEKELSLMRNNFETQLEALKASNKGLLQRIERISAEKKGDCVEPIKTKNDQEIDQKKRKEKIGGFSGALEPELEKITGKRIPSSNSFHVFLRQVTSAVKGNRKLLKKNILLTEKTENGWTVTLKNWNKKSTKASKNDRVVKPQIKEQTNRYSPFLIGVEKDVIKHETCVTKVQKVTKQKSVKTLEKKCVVKPQRKERTNRQPRAPVGSRTDVIKPETCITNKKIDRSLSNIKENAKPRLMAKQKKKGEKAPERKQCPSPGKKEAKKRSNWAAQLTKDELLRIALEGKKPKDCKYKLVVAYGLPVVDHINREVWARLLGVEEKFIPLIKDIKDAGRIFLVRDECCIPVVQALHKVSGNVRILMSADGVADYISKNRSTLVKIISDLRPQWSKYVPVDKAIKVIKKGLNENSKVSQKEFFFDEVSYEDLRGNLKGDNLSLNE